MSGQNLCGGAAVQAAMPPAFPAGLFPEDEMDLRSLVWTAKGNLAEPPATWMAQVGMKYGRRSGTIQSGQAGYDILICLVRHLSNRIQ